jgi:hypothetical protein
LVEYSKVGLSCFEAIEIMWNRARSCRVWESFVIEMSFVVGTVEYWSTWLLRLMPLKVLKGKDMHSFRLHRLSAKAEWEDSKLPGRWVVDPSSSHLQILLYRHHRPIGSNQIQQS